jgi:hypothetical protein
MKSNNKKEITSINKKEITSDTIKKDVLHSFFDRFNYYEYRYLMIKSIDDLKKNEKNIEYVIPHIKGDPYFLFFNIYDRKNETYLIEKKKLKFNLSQCDINEINIYSCNIKSTAKTYIGSIFDGRFVDNIFLIQDCYLLEGVRMNAWKLEKKIKYIDEYISKNIKNSYLKIRKVDHISNIQELDNTISKSSIDINGYIFLQGRSGISYIFIDNENFKKKTDQNINIKQIKKSKETNLIFTIKKDAKPDVYHVYDENNNLIHFASIPDTFTSQLCFDALKTVDSAKFKCEMCPRWNRYKPVECIN